MRIKTSSLIGIVLLAAGTIEFSAHLSKARASGFQSDNDPKILSARVKGKNLIVIGVNFSEGAMMRYRNPKFTPCLTPSASASSATALPPRLSTHR